MKDKKKFIGNICIAIVVALMGALLIASYFIPVLGPTKSQESVSTKYSCCDVIKAMNATKDADLSSEAIEEAWRCISETEGTAGQLVRIVGVLGMINAMIGAAIAICAIASIFLKYNILRVASLGFCVAALLVSIAIITLICVYLGIITTSTYPYSFYYLIHAASFVMLAASLFGGVGSWFLGYFDKEQAKQE